MPWASKTNPGKCCCTPPNPGACTVYAVQVTAPSGDPISGITVTLNRRIGVTTNPFSGTISNLSGTTDSDGLLTYTLAPGDVVSGSTATIPMGGPTIPNNSATQVGTTCTYRYQLCHVTNVTTTMDGTAVRSRA